MTVGKAIYYLLTNSTDIAAIVSTRVFPEVAQQDAPLPYIVYNISNNEPSDTKAEPSEMDTANVEVNCFSTSYTESIDLGVAVRAALDRVTGTYNGVNVQSIAYMNETLNFDEAQRAYLVSSDYDVRISRTDFEIAQGSPVTGVDLGDLADVNTTGVTNGQVIAYDAATSVWLPATDGGAISLNDLTDVIISTPESGEFFRYDGGEWVNDTAAKGDVGLGNVDNTSDANKPVSTAAQTALDLKADITSVPTDLDDLDDVQIIGIPTLGQALVYGAGKWLPGAAGATDLGDLDDVNTTGAAFGSLLTFNGSSWDISAGGLPTDDIYFHQRYETESEALRAGATATVELYFTCTAQGNGLAESASTDTPTAGYVINRKIYYSEAGFANPATGTWVEFTPAPADDATFATVKAALLEHLKARTGGTVPISLKQTWVEVAAAPSFTGLLNETYGSGAAAAYSTRRLNGNYTGACMTILRASDSTTTAIGFSSEDIDEAAITTFCTGTTCTVQTWHDQSQTGGTGVGNDATQTSGPSQPTIYTGGAIVKENGKVAASFDGSDDELEITRFSYTALTTIAIAKTSTPPAGNAQVISQVDGFLLKSAQTGTDYPRFQPYDTAFRTAESQVDSSDTQILLFGYVSGGNANIYVNGTAGTTASVGALNNPTNNIFIGKFPALSNSGNIGPIQEIIMYDADKSTNRTDIESNIGDYFTQNTPLLDTYTGAAACYSLRLMRTAYTGSAIRVRRSSDSTEQDIGFNVFGELDTVSLAAFCGTSDGFASKIYDQSGGTIGDLQQTSTGLQRKIYDGTTGYLGYLESVTNGGYYRPTSSTTISQPFSVFGVYEFDSAGDYFFDGYGSANRAAIIDNSLGTQMYAGSSIYGSRNITSQSITSAIYNGTSSAISVNGEAAVTGDVGSNSFDFITLGTRYSTTATSALKKIYEFVIYEDAKNDTDRVGIQNNLNGYYSAY